MNASTDQASSLVTAIPFSAHLGLRAEDDGAVSLTLDEHLANHIGTMHAGALFTLGESASGIASMRSLAAVFEGGMIVAKNATIAYKKPARGRIKATGKLRESAESVLTRLDADGKVTFEVDVTLGDEAGVEVATMTVNWYARKAAPTG